MGPAYWIAMGATEQGRRIDLVVGRCPFVAVLDLGPMRVQIEHRHDRPRTVRRRQRQGLPPPRGEAQGSVLQLGLSRREPRRQLPEYLGVRVQRVAGGAPGLERKLGPAAGRHSFALRV